MYRGLDSYTVEEDKIDFMQNSIRIISGLYGLLKPLDLIQPYRLEMGTKMPVGDNKNLYEFWRQKITTQLNSDLDENEPVLNLASNEYFKAIDRKVVKTDIYTANFKQLKNEEYKTIAIFSKKASSMLLPNPGDKLLEKNPSSFECIIFLIFIVELLFPQFDVTLNGRR